ncbi:MAG: tetratricopeptide repeat protein [Pseudomonadota bacterium]
MKVIPPHRCAVFGALVLLVLTACGTGSGGGLSLGPQQQSVSGAYLQGRFAAQEFNISAAETAFQEVARREPGPKGNRTAFIYALASGSSDLAEKQARLVISSVDAQNALDDDIGVQKDLPRLTLATAAMRDNNPEAALRYLEEDGLTSSLSRSLAVLLRSAALYDAEGQDAGARALLDVEQGLFTGLIPLQGAFLSLLAGDPRAAEIGFRAALGAPRRDVAALGYAQFLEAEARGDDAVAIYTSMIQDGGLYARAGRMGLTRLGVLEGQDKTFRKRAEKMPPLVEDADGLFAMALANYAWLGFEQAIQAQGYGPLADQRRRASMVVPLALANLARDVEPSSDIANYLAALIYSFFDEPEDALEAVEAIKPTSWLYTFAQLEAADSARNKGSVDDAIKRLRSAMKDDPGAPQLGLQLHATLLAEKRYQEADKVGTQAIAAAEALSALPSSLWRYYFSRGAGRIDAGTWQSGIDDLEKALELAPDEPAILNHLGYSYVEEGQQLDRAFGMIERALALQPDNGAIVDSLGWAHYQRGNIDEAVTYLERAVSLEPSDAVITDHLGDAYFVAGRKREARYEWQRVLGLDDADAELLKRVRAKLNGETSGIMPAGAVGGRT